MFFGCRAPAAKNLPFSGNAGDLFLPGFESKNGYSFDLALERQMRGLFFLKPLRAAQFALLLLLAGTNPAAAQEATRVEVYEYGLYELGPALGEYAPPNM